MLITTNFTLPTSERLGSFEAGKDWSLSEIRVECAGKKSCMLISMQLVFSNGQTVPEMSVNAV